MTPCAQAECVGEGSYRVCSESYQDADGDFHVRSSDTEGNSYGVDSTTRTLPGGSTEIRSDDSEGNSYSVKSWSDSTGVHSVDSEGNECTITNSGVVIGCGE
ncbi:hypothetical protein [Rhizobium sp. 21-4511-3d]